MKQLLIFLLRILLYNWNRLHAIYNKLKKDFRAIKTNLQLILEARKVIKEDQPFYKRFEFIAKRHPNKTAILFENERWSFGQIQQLINATAIYFEEQGYGQGDSIALLLHNCPEYCALWLGLSKIGVITALINTNLSIESLLHSIRIANCKAIIYEPHFEKLITTPALSELSLMSYYLHRIGGDSFIVNANSINLRIELDKIDPTQCLRKVYNVLSTDPLLYIYTSGTTGLPKAAIVTNIRYSLCRSFTKTLTNYVANAIIYCPMPLYHSSACALGIGPMLTLGATVALRRNFSASNYWKDCKKYNCNIATYIGEMLRYVLKASDNDNADHCLDVICGNGLKPEIWKQFIEKYKVKKVVEYYGCTEGTCVLVNFDNTVGAVGYVPSYLRRFLPLKLIRFSEETEEPIRDENGFCIECKENEPGLAIGKLVEGNEASNLFRFSGYTNKNESSKKKLHDVFKKGDYFFNFGDLLFIDEHGYYRFVDRIGDTFRWKGENVSTTEVESVISRIIGLNDAVVYGVKIPGTEGRAGMVSLVDYKNTLDLSFLLEKFQESLAAYAIPIFIRVLNNVPMTSTFKLQKFKLRSEGFNINIVKDTLYFYDVANKRYIPLTEDIYNRIKTGNFRL